MTKSVKNNQGALKRGKKGKGGNHGGPPESVGQLVEGKGMKGGEGAVFACRGLGLSRGD